MLLFIDGFDHYVTGDLSKKWTGVTNSPTIETTGGRRGGGCLVMLSNAYDVSKTLAASASWVIGFALKVTALSNATDILQLLDAGTVQVNLRVNVDGTLQVMRNATAVTGGASASAISIDTWYFVELKITIANSIGANSCVVRINNVAWITVATGQDLQNTANASANQVKLIQSGGSSLDPRFDDFYVCDQTGSAPTNDFLGDVRIDTLYPTSDGNYTQFTPSTGTDHYALVDETTPNTTDYVDGDTVGDRDSYGFANLTALTSQTVYGVQVNAAIVKDDAGAKSASTFARSSATNTDGASVALGTTQAYVSQVFETDPNGGGAWTESSVNAAEFGVRVTA